MVGRWGMSDRVGLVTVLPPAGEGGFLVADPAHGASPHTQELVDAEVRRIVAAGHATATHVLPGHRAQLDALAQALLERETLDEAEAYAAAGVPPGASPQRPDPAAPLGAGPPEDGELAPAGA
jgi:cell division protease FtsH